MKTERISFLEWLQTMSSERIQQFGVASGNAEAFQREVRAYGLAAFQENIMISSQIEMCNAYSSIYR